MNLGLNLLKSFGRSLSDLCQSFLGDEKPPLHSIETSSSTELIKAPTRSPERVEIPLTESLPLENLSELTHPIHPAESEEEKRARFFAELEVIPTEIIIPKPRVEKKEAPKVKIPQEVKEAQKIAKVGPRPSRANIVFTRMDP